ncbi:MAG TPA: AAA family ATPase, partial [Planctomycetota bacterium]|nr:AAA family ATPase [Planctomycetota bacterium]
TINHSLLTLSALRARSIAIAGVVLSGPRSPENRAAIETFGDVKVVGEVEPLGRLGPQSIARAAESFDPEGDLEEYFT